MAYIFLSYVAEDELFAKQLAVQLQQRGLVIGSALAPVPSEVAARADRALDGASHVLIILSPLAVESPGVAEDAAQAMRQGKHIIMIQHKTADIPDALVSFPRVDFRGRFLLAVEDLVEHLQKTDAPTRPLTVEHPPPVVKEGLLPTTLPAERCWRDDRLRINYNLPMVLADEELAVRLPAFFATAQFDLLDTEPPIFRGQRRRRFGLFDPRRAEHTLTVEPLEGTLLVYYQMTRIQVYHWFPAHYRAMDRESAALYRYLATGSLQDILEPVRAQARTAQVISWAALIIVTIVVLVFFALLLDEFAGVSVF